MHQYRTGFLLGLALFAVNAAAQTTQTVMTTGGTAYTVPLFTGSATAGNSAISQSTTGNVLVGSGSANQLFTVNGGSIFLGTAGTNGGMYITSSQAAPAYHQIGYRFGQDSAMTQRGMLYDQATASVNLINTNVGNTPDTEPITSRLTVMPNGYVGIGTGIPTTSPAAMLEVGLNAQMDGNITMTGTGATITFPDNSVQKTAFTGVICGGDYAESVDVTGSRTSYEPGDVLVIDPGTPGKFLKSAEAYSTLAAGIYSTKPGTVGRRQATVKSPDEVPMALVGIVPTKVSAENGPIKAGDLLVTSSTIGYAMKGTDRSRLTGAVIGKALGPLDSGTGVIEVLVTLQ